MRRRPKAVARVTVCITMLGTGGVVAASADAAYEPGPIRTVDAITADDPVAAIRSFATAEHGVRRPGGLAWDPETRRPDGS